MRLLFSILAFLASFSLYAQALGEVSYVEKLGNGGTRVFAVSVPGGNNLDKLAAEADRIVIETILFKGVENYNNGRPLVTNPSDAFAKSVVNPKNMVFKTYCKTTALENTNYKTAAHFVVEVNHYNLLRILDMRGSMSSPFQE